MKNTYFENSDYINPKNVLIEGYEINLTDERKPQSFMESLLFNIA